MTTAAPAQPSRTWVPLPVDDIQGNILAPFEGQFQEFLFLSFRNVDQISTKKSKGGKAKLLDSRRRARDWLRELVDEAVAPPADVDPAAISGAPRRVSVSFTSAALVTLHPELAADLVGYEAFWAGALADREYGGARRSSPVIVGDQTRSDPRCWAVAGPGQLPVDALLTIAADSEDELDELAQTERDRAEESGFTVLPVIEDDSPPVPGQQCELEGGKEPFGFQDGISQPGIRGFTAETFRNNRWESDRYPGKPIIAAGEFVLGYEREGGSYPSSRRPDPPAWMKNGSFQVLLRLRQDVVGWTTQMQRLSAASRNGVDVAAQVIGRKTDGTPLAPVLGAAAKSPPANDFTYDNDPDGVTTPRFAHIRKMNPRNEAVFQSRVHRILRRGIPFTGPGPNTRGLMFNAFMASIEDQFEYLMRNWAGNPVSVPTSPTEADGPDPVVGASDEPCFFRQVGQAGQTKTELHFGRYVWTTGAVYAFAPSISLLRKLTLPDEIVVR